MQLQLHHRARRAHKSVRFLYSIKYSTYMDRVEHVCAALEMQPACLSLWPKQQPRPSPSDGTAVDSLNRVVLRPDRADDC